VPALASLSIRRAVLRSAQTLIAAGLGEDGIHPAIVAIAWAVEPGTDLDPDKIAGALLDRIGRVRLGG
jgi:hypothetical protein